MKEATIFRLLTTAIGGDAGVEGLASSNTKTGTKLEGNMQQIRTAVVLAIAFTACAIASTAWAKSQWQKPVVMNCSLAPGSDCNVEAECPSDAPYVVVGGGGMPKATPESHAVGMTMNLPISKQKWRVRWRNMSPDSKAEVKVAVRIKCSDSAGEAGW